MSASTSIEWTDKTWNPVRGCSRISPGCGGGTPGSLKGGCYAERVAIRFSGEGKPYHGLVKQTPAGPRWTGVVRLVPEVLEEPLHWRKPARVFVNSMSDLFHEGLLMKEVAQVFAVMALAPRHTFQVLTKRAEHMARTMGSPEFQGLVASIVCMEATRRGLELSPDAPRWPLPNVWLGVSVERQQEADARVPHLLSTPAAVRFLSCEPLLGPVDVSRWLVSSDGFVADEAAGPLHVDDGAVGVDWVIVGGESGHGARPMHPCWARELREQCVAVGAPFFFKQWGDWKPYCAMTEAEAEALYLPLPEGATGDERRTCKVPDVVFPTRPMPEGGEVHQLFRLGKRSAGRELDGRTWDEFPEVHHG